MKANVVILSICILNCLSIVFADASEFNEQIFLKNSLKKNAVILEAGAYDGHDSIMLASLVPEGRVYAFEPVPANFHMLKKNVASFRNIKIFPLALAAYNGSCLLHLSSASENTSDNYLGSSSILEPTEAMYDFFPNIRFQKTIHVKCITLDKFLEREHIVQIDFLWLDLQGAELEVLKASPKALEIAQLIKAEVSVEEIYSGSKTANELEKFLLANNFELVFLKTDHVQGDAYFIKRKI